jgi:hypothetical protein
MHLLSGRYKREKALAARLFIRFSLLQINKPFICCMYVLCCAATCHAKQFTNNALFLIGLLYPFDECAIPFP